LSEIFKKKKFKKKNSKHLQKEKKYFIAYGQILKFFQAYFSNKNCIFFMFKKSKNGYRNQFMIIH